MATKTKTIRAPKMTAAAATSFTGISTASILQLSMALDTRRAEEPEYTACNCEPYADVFTFARWEAQGYKVNKGTKSLRISSFVPVTKKDGTPAVNEQEKKILRPATLHLFCRCQVEKREGK